MALGATALGGAVSTADAQLRLRERDAREGSEWHWDQCIGGLTYGAPYKLAASWGGGLIRESMTNGDDQCLVGVGKVGFGGASASLGYGRSVGASGGGAMLTGGVLRTFRGSWRATPQRTYVGASLHVWPMFALGGEIGYYVRLGDATGASDAQKRVVTWSVGFGF